jgi:hypothetical protein
MPDRFTQHLASQLGVPEDQARTMLAAFNDSLAEELDRSGVAVIPEIGTFTTAADGTEFEADAALQSLVNARHDALRDIVAASRTQPVEETPEQEIPEETEPEEVDDADVVVQEAASASEATVEEPSADGSVLDDEVDSAPELEEEDSIDVSAPVGVSESAAGDDDIEPEIDAGARPAEPLSDEPAVDLVEHESDLPTEPEGVDDDARGHAEPPPPPPEEEMMPPETPQPAADRPPAPSRQKRSGVPWLLVGVVVLIFAAIGLFVLMSGGEREVEPTDPIIEALPPADDEITDEDAFDDDAVPDEAPADEAPPESPATDTPAPETADPVYGESIDRSQSRYTLVIASLPSQGAAETVMNSWRNRGFRTDVFSETIDGVTRYRVGIGQFDTIDRADSVRSESAIASDLPEGTWVYRYPASSSN